MKRSEFTEVCNAVLQLHINDLKSELPKIIQPQTDNYTDTTSLIANLTAEFCILQTTHTVQIVSDVLTSFGLIELNED